ncbi:hypothetical protein F5Y17DRAFT_458841 [Xylariaceae sp. FL0594]|nr:hypothetical protein F5Y17DRAFT_458841 [Xylariaceae sp. FL0594]
MPKKLSENAIRAFKENPEFAKAYKEATGLIRKPTDQERLNMYALAKIGQDEPIGPKPKAWEFEAKAKHSHWSSLLSEKTPEQARADYIALVEKLKETYGFDETKVEPLEGVDI